MKLIDHTYPKWAEKVRRTSGAITYSKELVEYQIPNWQRVLPENSIISTCSRLSDTDVKGSYEIAVQYLHSYPYHGAIERIQQLSKTLPFRTKRLVFITAYRAFEQELKEAGFEAYFVPMGIVGESADPSERKERFIYFGNVVQTKIPLFNRLKTYVYFDVISNNKFNNKKTVTRAEALKIISTYKYGIGVGRAAQEMFSLGLKVMIAGQKFGGLITNDEEYERQLDTNMNGRIVTCSQNIQQCLAGIEKSIIRFNDITKMDHSLVI